jgi:hypothetical protein
MKVNYKSILALILALVMMICMCACGNKSEEADASGAAADSQTEEQAEASEEPAEDLPEAVKTIEGIDDEETLKNREPLMIDSITLYDDGSLAVVPNEDLRKNEIKDDAEAVYPFEESGKVKDFWVVDYGNAGYRTIIALLKDGSISAVNGRALVEDHIFAVMDDVANRDNFESVENRTDEDASTIVGITEDGEEVLLDYSLNFDEPESSN